MKSSFLTAVFLFLTPLCFSQYVLKGTVADARGKGIPRVKIYVDSTTYGVISDFDGNYFLELKEEREYPIRFKMQGFNDTLVKVSTDSKVTYLNLVLKEKSTQLESVEVVTKKINVANGIVKQVRKNRKNMAYQFGSYTCNTYLKTSLENESRKADSLGEEKPEMSLVESVSQTSFIAPDFYNEKIVAHHDFSNLSKKSVKVFSDLGSYYKDDIIPSQVVKTDPYIFYEKVQDGDFNLYQHTVHLPKIAEHPIVSPFGAQCFTNYIFKLTNVLYEGGHKVYEIQVNPRFKSAPLVKGQLYIIDELWVVKSFHLSINLDALTFFHDFSVIHDYEQVEGYWVAVRREYIYTIKEKDKFIKANARVDHSNYVFNIKSRKKDFKNELSSYAEDAFTKDTNFWNNSRPILLKSNELNFIAERRRVDSIKQSKHYLDSIDDKFNKIRFIDVVLSGVGFRNRYKRQSLYIDPILGSFQLFGVGSFRY